MSAQPPARAKRARLLRGLWLMHRWLGLCFGAVLLIISVTGGLLVVHDALEAQFEKSIQVVEPQGKTTALTPVVQKLAQAHPEVRPTFVRFDAHDDARAWKFYLRNDENRELRFVATVNPYTGEKLSIRPQDRGTLTGFLLQLHFNLLLGKWGTLITAAAGVALILACLTGFYIYRQALRDMWHWPFRRVSGSRHIVRDLHRWVGVWALLFNLLIGITGVWFMVLVIQNRFSPPKTPTAALYDHSALPDLDAIIAQAHAHFPAAELLSVSIPQRAGGKIGVMFLHRDAAVWHKFSTVSFDSITGKQLAVQDARTQPFWSKFRSILAPLHFGFYGAKWVQVIYAIGGFTPALLSITGIVLWWRRHKLHQHAAAPARLQPGLPHKVPQSVAGSV